MRRESSSIGALLQSTMGNFKSIIGTSLLLTKDVRIFIRAIPRGMGHRSGNQLSASLTEAKNGNLVATKPS